MTVGSCGEARGDALPPHRRDGRRGSARRLSLRDPPQWRRPRRAREEHMGGVGPDAARRNLNVVESACALVGCLTGYRCQELGPGRAKGFRASKGGIDR